MSPVRRSKGVVSSIFLACPTRRSRRRSAILKLGPLLDILPVPEPRAADDDHRRWEASGPVQEALAGLPDDQLDLTRADEIGGSTCSGFGLASQRQAARLELGALE
jgi:hypothetical protein